MKIQQVELGCPGHLIVSHRCQWRRHTQLTRPDGTGVRISSLGDYRLPGSSGYDTLGPGDDEFFECMVFATTPHPAAGSEGCGCSQVVSWCEVDAERSSTRGRAQEVHENMIVEWKMKLRNGWSASDPC